MKARSFNLLIPMTILVLTGCSGAKDALQTVVDNTAPISLSVHEKENDEILIDISETHQYSLETPDDGNSVLKVYSSEGMLFSKEYNGVIHQADDVPSVFELDGYFYLAVNFSLQNTTRCTMYRVSISGDQDIIISEHFDYGMNTNFYVDSDDGSFYLSFQTDSASPYTLLKYLYESGAVVTTSPSTEYFSNLYLGIRNIVHNTNGDTYICTNNEYVYKNGTPQDVFSPSQIFQNDEGDICFYDVSRSKLDNAYYLERRNVDTKLTETFKAMKKIGASLLYAAYHYQKAGIFVLRTPELTTTIQKSIFSVFVYHDENHSLSAFSITDERIANICFHGSKLYFEAETSGGNKVLSYIDFGEV